MPLAMLPPLACTTALAVSLASAPAATPATAGAPATSGAAAASSSSGATSDSPAEPAEPARDCRVHIDLGPELARRMGLRVIVRPAGENFGNRRAAAALDLPRPPTPDQRPVPASMQLPAGLWRIEATAPGFLPSTREFTLDAARPEQTLRWPLLPASAHADVRFPVSADGASSVALTVRSTDGATTWTCTSQRTPCTLRLARGEWTVETCAAGFRRTSVSFTVAGAATQDVALRLEPGADLAPGTASRPVPPDRRRKLALGLGVAAAPVFAAGVGLAVAGRLQYVNTLRGDTCAGRFDAVCANAVVGPIHGASAGFGLLGAAVGLLATSATAAFPVKRQAWWIELGVGGAVTLIGAGWTIGNTVTLDRALQGGPLTDIAANGDSRFGASAVVGLGAGLTVGALTGLLLQRKSSRVAPYAAPGAAGLVWVGRF